MAPWLTDMALTVADAWMAAVPRPTPSAEALAQCRIVAHRGEHQGSHLAENTLAAFDRAASAGVWGIETDIRWTADLVPVIIHDADTARVFGRNIRVADATLAELREAVPEVPTLAEVVARFGTSTHLMLELKDERFPDLAAQKRILREHLVGLEAGTDYHLLALDPTLFERFDIVEPRHCLPVAMTNMAAMSKAALDAGYGGVTGHFLLLTDAIRDRHLAAGQHAGTGFIRSANALAREIHRGMAWIFTNDSVAIQHVLDDARRQNPAMAGSGETGRHGSRSG